MLAAVRVRQWDDIWDFIQNNVWLPILIALVLALVLTFCLWKTISTGSRRRGYVQFGNGEKRVIQVRVKSRRAYSVPATRYSIDAGTPARRRDSTRSVPELAHDVGCLVQIYSCFFCNRDISVRCAGANNLGFDGLLRTQGFTVHSQNLANSKFEARCRSCTH